MEGNMTEKKITKTEYAKPEIKKHKAVVCVASGSIDGRCTLYNSSYTPGPGTYYY
jgi:hypothetical protein